MTRTGALLAGSVLLAGRASRPTTELVHAPDVLTFSRLDRSLGMEEQARGGVTYGVIPPHPDSRVRRPDYLPNVA
jgi:hypothetical protein